MHNVLPRKLLEVVIHRLLAAEEAQRYSGAFAGLAFDQDFALVCVHDLPYDG
jgi:hypothetical protein